MLRMLSPLLLLLCCPLVLADDPAAKASGPRPQPTPVTLGVEDLDALVEPLRAKYELPALAVAVTRHDKLIGAAATGVRRAGHNERVGLNDKFHIGSCTKSMTAYVCARLVDQGKLRWDSTVGEVFADQKDAIKPAWYDVTLTQLLCHRAGLPDDRSPGRTLFKMHSLEGTLLEQRRAFVPIALEVDPATAPDSEFTYSNDGITLAGAMAERVTNKSFEDLLQELLFEPLTMKSGGYGAPGDAKKVDHPWGHQMFARLMYVRPSKMADNPAVMTPAGRVHCSVLDWCRYARWFMQSARGDVTLLKPETFAHVTRDAYDQGYTFGWGVGERDWAKGKVYQHAGSNARFLAQIQIMPEEDLAVVIAMNRADRKAQEALGVISEAVRSHYLKPTTQEVAP